MVVCLAALVVFGGLSLFGGNSMYRTTLTVACVAAMLVTGVMTGVAPAQNLDVVWDGGDGEWTNSNWNGGSDVLALIGQDNGSDGSSDKNGGTRIIIGGGAAVLYDANATDFNDFRVKQGSDLVLQDGASWTQNTTATWPENLWTEMDLSNLVLDGGTFIRTGSVPGEGGGAVLFGSWRGDDNFGNPSTPPPEVINISITNGGGIENEGQLWFGSWADGSEGLTITMTIDDGSLDLTGGDVPGVGDEGDADLLFSLLDNDPVYTVNFTGPGSITVDKSGILAPVGTTDPDTGDVTWSNLSPITYEELWDLGILQANGLSGPDGETFADHFTVTGSLGADDYVLTSEVGDDILLGDVNLDKEVNGLDVDPFVGLVTTGDFQVEGDMNGDGAVNGLDVDPFVAAVVGGGIQAVPEPATLALAGMGLLGLLWFGRKRR
jgi:hypothetical protein